MKGARGFDVGQCKNVIVIGTMYPERKGGMVCCKVVEG